MCVALIYVSRFLAESEFCDLPLSHQLAPFILLGWWQTDRQIDCLIEHGLTSPLTEYRLHGQGDKQTDRHLPLSCYDVSSLQTVSHTTYWTQVLKPHTIMPNCHTACHSSSTLQTLHWRQFSANSQQHVWSIRLSGTIHSFHFITGMAERKPINNVQPQTMYEN